MLLRYMLVFVLAVNLASAFWPFSDDENSSENDYVNSPEEELEDLFDESSEDPDPTRNSKYFFSQCLDYYSCEKCYAIKKAGKCSSYKKFCYQTCSDCKGPVKDNIDHAKCLKHKKDGYCSIPQVKFYKCIKTCSICAVDGNWGEWSAWSTCSKTCKQGKQSRNRQCNDPKYGGKPCEGESSQTRVCNEKVDCPVDGNWGDWSEWSTCSKTCKQGKQSRSRKCDSPAPQYGGKECEGESSETQDCNKDVPCPVDGNWGDWSAWSTCSKTCKQGKQSRSRQCDNPAPQFGGKPCKGESSETQDCNEDVPCPVDANWGDWSKWSTCSQTCKQGKQSRSRKCDNPAPQFGGRECDGESSQTQDCNVNVPCPVDGNWGDWSAWSTCSKTCKQGKQSRSRKCDSPAPQFGGKPCVGESSQTQDCNENVRCPVDGNWGDWSAWSTCSKTCKQGTQSRSRQCDSPAPQFGGKPCKGESNQTRVCNEDVPCPVDGNWGEWSKWSTCSKTCKQGKQSRSRQCDNPAPQFGGKPCKGESSETQDCNENVPCPVDGNWGDWSAWSTCSKTCKQGTQSRSRQCDSPADQFGGKPCKGESSETQDCNEDVPCPVDGNWGEWSEWSTCSKTCKQGKQSRSRKCDSPAPQFDGKPCEGESSQTQDCNEDVPCPVNGEWGEWSPWSDCTKKCGGGTQSRVRQCNNPAPAFGGKKCEGAFRQTRVCNKDYCPVDGNWGEWSKWSACSKTCGYGVQKRKRYCDNPKPAHNGKPCLGDAYDKKDCHAYFPCPIDGGWTNWESWTPCTKTCGYSYRQRSRSCTNPPAQYGGQGCDGKNDNVERCKKKPCPTY